MDSGKDPPRSREPPAIPIHHLHIIDDKPDGQLDWSDLGFMELSDE